MHPSVLSKVQSGQVEPERADTVRQPPHLRRDETSAGDLRGGGEQPVDVGRVLFGVRVRAVDHRQVVQIDFGGLTQPEP